MSTRTLPIFPLPLVLFPGAPQLLHIFEPRYRQMLDDCLAGDHRFGISYVDPRSPEGDRPQVGDVGCRVAIDSVQRLPDGRSNIVCIGEARYVVEEFQETDRLYDVARVTQFDDDVDDGEDLGPLAALARHTFSEVMAGTWTTPSGRGPAPDDPKAFSFWIAATLDIDPLERQELLALRSTGQRLRLVNTHLNRVRDELMAEIGSGLRGKRNGNRRRVSADSPDS